jgi:small-conductance mechanosensitive channel
VSKDRSAAPALIEARAQTLLIGIVRLVLAAAGLGAAIAAGVRPAPAAALFAAGAVVLLAAVLSSRRGRLVWLRLEQAEPLESESKLEPRHLAVLRAAYPSTIGLTVLIAIALLLQPTLAALLAGILAGIGGAALGFAAQLTAWERQRGARVLAEPGKGGRVFEAPR